MGSMWHLQEKMLLMPMSLGAGMVSAQLIVLRGVLVFPILRRVLHGAGQRCRPLLPLWVLSPIWCFPIFLDLAGGKTPLKTPGFPRAGWGPPMCPRVRGCSQGSGRHIPAPLKSRPTAEPPNSPLFMPIILITSASCLRGRMSFIDSGK